MNDWTLTGNVGTDPANNFLGTTDNQALEIRVNNARALRIEPGPTPNLIGGFSGNVVQGGCGSHHRWGRIKRHRDEPS
jgi:hypothetical protein